MRNIACSAPSYVVSSGEIVQAIKDLDQVSSEEERQKLQRFITDSVDSEVKTLDDDRKQAQEVLGGLDSFRQRTAQHNDALKDYEGTLDFIVASENSAAEHLKTNIEELSAAAQSGNAALQDQIADCERRISIQVAVVAALDTIHVRSSSTRRRKSVITTTMLRVTCSGPSVCSTQPSTSLRGW